MASDKLFKLRKVLQSNSMDVRAITSYPNGFVCGSRDKIAKVYLNEESGSGYMEAQNFTGPTHYVSSVTVLTMGDEHLVYVGSNDACIYCFDILNSASKSILVGHSGTVCSLFADNENGLLLSGSWDQNCHVWKDNKTKKVLKGHNAAVWAVASLQRMIFTASADKTIKRWDEKGECVFTYTQHTDCVRGLAILSKERFLSCSNDATIKLWNVSDGSVIHSFTGHDNFIYDIAVIDTNPDNPEFLSCSEDRTVRIWKGLKDSFQSIRLPAPTAWSVAVIDKLNIAIAGSDGRVYTFTRDDSRVADESEIKTFEDEVGKSEVPLAELGDIKVDQLPGKEALMNPGKKEGATKLVREDGKICVYQWSQGKMEWSKVGDVVGDANPDKDPSSKTVFEGKEYDFVFNVDIEDGVPPLKLPFNAGDDPWMAAQQFIYKYNLSQLYLDQIANFIIKNAGDLSSSNNSSRTNQQASSEYVDPWTGGSRYIPQPK